MPNNRQKAGVTGSETLAWTDSSGHGAHESRVLKLRHSDITHRCILFLHKAVTYWDITLCTSFQTSKIQNLTASIEQVLGVCISLHIHIKFAQGLHKWDCLWGRWLAGDCSGKGSHWGTNIQWGPEGPVGKGRLASKWPPVVTPSQGWWGALSWG